MFLLACIGISFKVTEEDWLIEIDLSDPPPFFWMFLLFDLLKCVTSETQKMSNLITI